MDKWEYMSSQVAWDDHQKKWIGDWGGRSAKAEYIYQLLNPLGQDGWELVAFIPMVMASPSAVGTTYTTSWEAVTYRAIWKRRLL
jgi:hypothetical protein